MMISQKKLKNQLGFSMVGVLVSSVILSTGLLSLGSFQSNIIRSSTVSKERSAAVAFAQEGIETARSSIISIPDPTQLKLIIDAGMSVNEKQGQTAFFTRTVNTETLDNGDVEVKMSVSWPDVSEGDGTAATSATTVYLSSIISQQAVTDTHIRMSKVVLDPATDTLSTPLTPPEVVPVTVPVATITCNVYYKVDGENVLYHKHSDVTQAWCDSHQSSHAEVPKTTFSCQRRSS